MSTGKRRILVGVLIAVFICMTAAFFIFVLPYMSGGDESPPSLPFLKNSSPPKKPAERLVVCIDPGHGGTDPGAENGQRQEKDDTLKMALRVQMLLEEEGVTCYLTRTDDSALELSERLEFATSKEANVFVSIHRNKGGGEGLEIWIKSQASVAEKQLANGIQERMLDASGMRDRGVKQGSANDPNEDYAMNKAAAASCLLELGFMDNEEDNKLFDTHFNAIARAIADGILDAEV